MPFHAIKSKLFTPFISYLLILSLCLTPLLGCSTPQKATNENAAFETFTNQLFQQEVSSNTISLHYTLQAPKEYGILDAPVTYGSYSTDENLSKAAVENCKAAFERFAYKQLSTKQQLTYDVLESYLDTALTGADYLLYDEPLSPLTGIQAQLPVLLSEYQFHTSADVDTYLNLLSTTASYFDSLIEFEQKKSQKGLFMSPVAVDAIVKECTTFLEMGNDNYLYTTFQERLAQMETLTPQQIDLYVTQNSEQMTNSVFPAYQNLAYALGLLRDTGENPNGLRYLPEGRKYYEYVVARETGSSKSILALQNMTKEQIKSDLTAMQSCLSENGTGTEDIDLTTVDPTAILSNLEHNIVKTFPTPPKVNTQVKYVPEIMQEYLSPAFYLIPTIDNTSENTIYINQGRTMDALELYTTLAHEGYPGHLYQTTYYASQNPPPLRSILSFGGYVEGWATYAEMCSYYLSPLSKEQATLLQKNSSVILGLYALADIGIHYNGWTLVDTVAFFRDYGIKDTAAIKDIFALIVGDPANYLKYYIGYVEFLNLKKEAASQWGDDFSQKRFHKAVLDVGPAPFDIVEKYVLGSK